ncbi:MAG: hypothetical protein ACM3RX_01275, partial [Methanococcaceae archaeon]
MYFKCINPFIIYTFMSLSICEQDLQKLGFKLLVSELNNGDHMNYSKMTKDDFDRILYTRLKEETLQSIVN